MGRTYIVAVGYAGACKAADIIVEHEKELRSRYRSSFVDRMLKTCRASEKYAPGNDKDAEPVYMPHGYLGALYELAQERRCGISIRLRQVPVQQYVIEVCEMYGLDPYKLPTYASIYLTEDPQQFMEDLNPQPRAMAACIGYLTEGRDKVIIDKTNIEYINRISD